MRIFKNFFSAFALFDLLSIEYGVDIFKVLCVYNSSFIFSHSWSHFGINWLNFVDDLLNSGIIISSGPTFKVPLHIQLKIYLWLFFNFKLPFGV